MAREYEPAVAAGIILGVGLGGFVDGILLHQIIHWHNMGSAILPPVTVPAIEQNMMWDGLFHMAVWTCTVIGVYWLLADGRRPGLVPNPAPFTGLLLVGWGLFNLVEGILDHHLLELHHVRDLPRHVPVYDWVFLLIGGAGLIAAGLFLYRRREY